MTNPIVAAGLASALMFAIASPAIAQDQGGQWNQGQNYGEDQDPNRGGDPRDYDQRGYDNRGYDNRGYDNRGYDDRGYDNRGYDNRGYGNAGYENRG